MGKLIHSLIDFVEHANSKVTFPAKNGETSLNEIIGQITIKGKMGNSSVR
jgi:hypothetical protein